MAQLKPQGRSMQARVTARLRPVYMENAPYPLEDQAEASTVPTRCCTEIFYSGSQHNGGEVAKASSGDPYGSGRQTSGGGY